MEGWGEKADNRNWITIKIFKNLKSSGYWRVNTRAYSPIGGTVLECAYPVSHGGPWQALVQLAQRGTLALLSGISSQKTTCTQMLSQCLFWGWMTLYKDSLRPQGYYTFHPEREWSPPFSVYLVCYAVELMQAVSNYNLEMGFINILQTFGLINCWKGLTSYKYMFLPSIKFWGMA